MMGWLGLCKHAHALIIPLLLFPKHGLLSVETLFDLHLYPFQWKIPSVYHPVSYHSIAMDVLPEPEQLLEIPF